MDMHASKTKRGDPGALHGTERQDRILEPPNLWVRHRRLAIAALFLTVALIALVLAILHFSGAQDSVDRSRLTIATVERGNFVRDIAADGQVVAAVSPTLYALSAGNVALKVHAGDAVDKGEILAVINSPDLSAKLSQEESTLESLRIDWKRARLDAGQKLAQLRESYRQAEIDQKTAEREVGRSRKAYEAGSYSELQVLRAQDVLEKARFAYERAKMDYDSQPQQNRFDVDNKKVLADRQQYIVEDLQRQVESLQIRSPVTGRVGQVLVGDRASVAKDSALLVVVDLSALEIEIKVPESLARDLTSGMTADLEGDGRHWKGSVSAVSPQVVNGEVVARLRFGDEKPDGLRQSQRLSARVLVDRRDNVLMVDRGPFLEQDGDAFVYAVHGNIVERHPVRLGAVSVQKVEILEGLHEGDQMVVSGTDAFHGAQRVILTH